MFGLGKSKAVVGLDIGSSAVKAVELKSSGKGFKVTAFAVEPVPPDSIVDGAIIDGTAVADAIRRLFENKAFKTKEVAASLSGNAVIVKKISLPVMTEAGAGRVHLLGSGAVHPLRHPGRQSRLPDSRCGQGPRLEGHDGSAARGGQEGKDRRLHGRHLAGRPRGRRRRRGRLRAAERVRDQLRPRAAVGRRAAERRRQRDQHQHSERRAVGVHARHLDRAATPIPRRSRKSSTSRSRARSS